MSKAFKINYFLVTVFATFLVYVGITEGAANNIFGEDVKTGWAIAGTIFFIYYSLIVLLDANKAYGFSPISMPFMISLGCCIGALVLAFIAFQIFNEFDAIFYKVVSVVIGIISVGCIVYALLSLTGATDFRLGILLLPISFVLSVVIVIAIYVLFSKDNKKKR